MIIVIDTETTGLNPKKDELLQVSIINEEKQVLFNSYIKPVHTKNWDAAMEINNITPEMVSNAPVIDDVKETIQNIIDSADKVLGYNTAFDVKFLEAAGISVKKETLDAMRMLGKIENTKHWWKLEDIAVQMGYDYSKHKAHNSLTDCFATLYVYKRIRTPLKESVFTTKEDIDYFTGKKCDSVLYEIFRDDESEKERSRENGLYIYVSQRSFKELTEPDNFARLENVSTSDYANRLKAACEHLFYNN